MNVADDNGPLERRSPEGTISAEVTVPEGFVPYTEPGPFLDRVGPLYERDDDRGLVFGFCVLAHHCNRRGFAHGELRRALGYDGHVCLVAFVDMMAQRLAKAVFDGFVHVAPCAE